MKTRTGKIARLPRSVRDELNLRLSNNEPAAPLLAWLNALPEVRAILTAQFDGRDITDQNLSDWRQGGYEDWLRLQDAHDWVRHLMDYSSGIQEATGQASVADLLSGPVAITLGKAIQLLSRESPVDPECRKLIIAFTRELSLLRQGDHRAQFLRLQRDRLEATC
jgi:hypothetical protein